jgi:hypothetical protein
MNPEEGGSTLPQNVGDSLPVDKTFTSQKAWLFKIMVE